MLAFVLNSYEINHVDVVVNGSWCETPFQFFAAELTSRANTLRTLMTTGFITNLPERARATERRVRENIHHVGCPVEQRGGALE